MGGSWKKFDDIYLTVEPRLEKRVTRAMQQTVDDAAKYARSNHPSWENRSGKAEKSIQSRPVTKTGRHKFRARFGSYGVSYFIWLEIGTGSRGGDHTLQRAAYATFPKLWQKLEKLGVAT